MGITYFTVITLIRTHFLSPPRLNCLGGASSCPPSPGSSWRRSPSEKIDEYSYGSTRELVSCMQCHPASKLTHRTGLGRGAKVGGTTFTRDGHSNVCHSKCGGVRISQNSSHKMFLSNCVTKSAGVSGQHPNPDTPALTLL